MGTRQDVAVRIKTMRLSRGMTQKDLARSIGQSEASITMYETGRREPDFETLEAIADTFNVPLIALIDDGAYITKQDHELLEAMHQNPSLGLLFARSRKMSHKDVETVLAVVNSILGVNADE